ncbi:MAG: T9SS type A sorting domain-containing protein [Ignavibacterium sp.]
MDKYGYKPWGINKRILGESPEQTEAEIIEDSEGGVIVSYIDRYENLPYWTQKVRVQRVDSSGNFLWGATGIKVTLDEINQGDHHLVTDGDGGCVVSWQDVNYTYYVNRIDRNGNRLWGDNGITLNTGGANAQPIIVNAADGNYYLQAGTIIYRINQNGEILNQFSSTILGQPVPDLEGGIVLSGRVWTGMIPKLVAQREDSLDNNLWQEPFVEIADSLYLNTSLSIKQNNGYFYFGWTGKRNGINKVAQFQALRLDGTKLFSDGSIQVGNPPLNGTIVHPLEANRTAFIYYSSDFLPDSLLVQTYDTSGNKLWNEDGILIAHPPIEYQSYTTDGNGGFIIAGVINNFTIVAQQVSKFGQLGEIITSMHQEYQEIFPIEIILYQNYPNPFNPCTKINWQSPVASHQTLKVYDILGNEVATLVDEFREAGKNEVQFDVAHESLRAMASGVYIYKLQAGDFVSSKKMLLLK